MKRLLLTITLLSSLIYGTQLSAQQDTVTDIDGNVYHTVTIGTQTWMVENLKVTKYNNGTPIQHLTETLSWVGNSAGYCWFNKDVANKIIYGALYNWGAVETDNLAPKGWHVPSDDEWTILIDYLGGPKIAGGKMKVIGFSFWTKPNEGADNSSGFSAISGGCRNPDGIFTSLGVTGCWWSSTKIGTSVVSAKCRYLYNDNSRVNHFNVNVDKGYGFSVRCVKD